MLPPPPRPPFVPLGPDGRRDEYHPHHARSREDIRHHPNRNGLGRGDGGQRAHAHSHRDRAAATSAVQAHYDSLAQPRGSRMDSLRARAKGPLIEYKQCANALKRAQVLSMAGGGRVSLLADVGCGRGGDIAKWWDASIARVVATDLSAGELGEARRRQAEMARERARRGRGEFVGAIEWHAFDLAEVGLARKLLEWSRGERYGAVSCQFALQFFFKSRAAARALLRDVASVLAEGGAFFGIAPDGDAVRRLCDQHGGRFEMEAPFALRLRLLPLGGGSRSVPLPATHADAAPADAPAAVCAQAGSAAIVSAPAAATAPEPRHSERAAQKQRGAGEEQQRGAGEEHQRGAEEEHQLSHRHAPAAAPHAAMAEPAGTFGQVVTFALADTVTADSDRADCSEFLLHPAHLYELARAEGLEPIDAECGPMLEQAARHRLPVLSEPLQRVASLYFCFGFVRRSGLAAS
jgi:hypothetical protein